MDFILSLLLVFLTMLGLGVWLPVTMPGVRFMAGGALIPMVMQLGAVVFRLPLSWLGWGLLVAAAIGLLRRRTWPELRGLHHPIYVLPALVAAIGLTQGDISYIPYGQDEFTSWMYWPRQQYLADQVWRADMLWNIQGYVQGWPLSIVFAQTPWSDFSGVRAISLATLWHIALLGTVYDVVHEALRRRVPLTPTHAAALTWGFVLIVLAVETTWTLVPQLVQVEIPQWYLLSAGFIIALAALEQDRPDHPALILVCGLIFAAAYTIKIANAGALLALLIVAAAWAARQASWRTRIRGLAAFFGPPLLVAVSWSAFTPFASTANCFSGLDNTISARLQEFTSAEGRAVAAQLLQGTLAYIGSYKLPLTLVALAGLLLGVMRHDARALVAGLVVWVTVFIAGLLPIYMFCLVPFAPLYELESLQRYLMVPVRVIQLTGLTLLAVAAVDIAAPHLRALTAHWPRLVATGATIVAITLLVWQGIVTHRALANVATRQRETPDNVAAMRRLDREAASLRTLIGRPKNPPTVILIAQGATGYERDIARYLALHRHRGDALTIYRLHTSYSWGATPRNGWMATTTAAALVETFQKADILWPFVLDDWMHETLAALVADPACAAAFDRYFLVRDATDKFHCVPKPGEGASLKTGW